jgi:hypothetical protein
LRGAIAAKTRWTFRKSHRNATLSGHAARLCGTGCDKLFQIAASS